MHDSDLARDIPAFLMYCVNGTSRSSLLRLYDRISVLKSIPIIVPCVTICSFYQCIVYYHCRSADIN